MWWVPLATTAASIAASSMGNSAAARANAAATQGNMNTAAENVRYAMTRDMENEALQREYNNNERRDAQRQLELMREGYQDPVSGIRVHYEAGKGWVTDYTGSGKALAEAQRNEELQNLMVDQPMARRGRQANESRRLREGSMADQILSQLGNPDPYEDDRIIADLTARNRSGIEDSYRGVQASALMNAARTGTSGGNIIAKLAREKARSYSDADAGAYTEGLKTAESLRGSRSGRLTNDYNTFANRAANVDNYALPGNDSRAAAFAGAGGRSGQGESYGGNSRAIVLGNAPQLPTNMYNASAMPGASTANSMYGLSSMFNKVLSSFDTDGEGKKKNAGAY